MKFNKAEQQVIILKSSYDLLRNMVNNNFVTITRDNTEYSQVIFKTEEKFFVFLTYLSDFLSKPDKSFINCKNGFLGELFEISLLKNHDFLCGNPSLLRLATMEMREWLRLEIIIEKIYLPSLEKEVHLKISRIDLIKLTANYNRHHFSRYTRNTSSIQRILASSGCVINEDQVFIVLDELINDWFMDILSYQTQAIYEYLSNIKWAIYSFLNPVFGESYQYLGEDKAGLSRYEYSIPPQIKSQLVKALYWELMEDVRDEPYISKFKIFPILKSRY